MSGGTVEKLLLYRAQNGACASCGHRMLAVDDLRVIQHPMRPTVDHVWPKARGGYNNLSNKVLMHRCCNELKAMRAPNGCELLMLEMVKAKLAVDQHGASTFTNPVLYGLISRARFDGGRPTLADIWPSMGSAAA